MAEWRPISGHPFYLISSDGQVWSRHSNRLRKLESNAFGYRRIYLGAKRRFFIHRLVAEAFIGPRPSPDHVPNHKNGIKADNRVENLEWVTKAENIVHASRLGLLSGGKPGRGGGKLNWDQVLEIRRLASTTSNLQLAKQFDVNPSMIGLVVNGKAWKQSPEQKRNGRLILQKTTIGLQKRRRKGLDGKPTTR